MAPFAVQDSPTSRLTTGGIRAPLPLSTLLQPLRKSGSAAIGFFPGAARNPARSPGLGPTLGRIGSLEVRLTRASGEDVRSDAPPFRLEVFSPASSTAMESLGCFNFDDGELAAAARFVLRAGHDTTAHPQLGASPCVC